MFCSIMTIIAIIMLLLQIYYVICVWLNNDAVRGVLGVKMLRSKL